MIKEKREEEFFRQLMAESKLESPSPGFDDDVMKLVAQRQKKGRRTRREIKLSWIFFITGSAFGIFISVILPGLLEGEKRSIVEQYTFPFQILFALLFVTQINNLLEYYKEIRRMGGRE